MKFTQRCLKCGSVLTIEIEQKKDKPMQKPKDYTCDCGHKGKYGEKNEAPNVVIQTIPDEQMPPVMVDGEQMLVVDGKRVPFTLGRIQLLKKDIAKKMGQLDSLEKAWAKESEDKK